ncbi:MAG: FG-GAP-like repeat-containing protein [Planctomycetota bacterium]|nr:FG-GAP-like repeat-containing protein [Planctomycetota bacterium]
MSLPRPARSGPLWSAGFLFLAGSLVQAQQFVNVPGAIPGTVRWSEGCEGADVDNDGDLDIFIADGDGFSSPGTKRQNVLIINQLEIAPNTFADESVARLGVHLSNGKMAITGDIDDDGWIDAMYCNAFGTDRNSLYVNQGLANPGFFSFEGVARGFATLADSGGGMFGDVDNDGDLDALLCNDYIDGGSSTPRLYFNDGLGFFTEDAAFAAGAPAKNAQMDVHLVDIDNDWDLDFFGPNRANNPSGNHYLMLNDGNGNFTDASSLVPNATSNVYEAEVSDLDGDGDVDMFFISLAAGGGFSPGGEGPVTNNLVPSGSLTFTAGSDVGGDDDNEVALLDYDNDGDLDAIIGSLGSREKMLRNEGPDNFVIDNSVIQAIGDSTLDLTVLDLNNDGAYDIFTVQGESGAAQWANKVYVNTGAPDTIDPVVKREESLAGATSTGPWVVRAVVQDQVMDDARDWISSSVEYVVNTTNVTGSVSITGGGFSPAVLNIAAGTTVTWTNNDGANHSVTSSTTDYDFDSGPIAPGGTYSTTFVSPGTYDYQDTIGALGAAQVVVSGSATSGKAQSSGVGMVRFQMDDTAAGAGVELTYELSFVDWAGNTTITESRRVDLGPVVCGWSQYDVGASPANTIDLDGGGSASIGQVLQVQATNVPATAATAMMAISLGQANQALLGGIVLIDIGQILTQTSLTVSGGAATWNLPIPNDPTLPGTTGYFQCIAMDPGQPGGWALSNGLEVIVCP